MSQVTFTGSAGSIANLNQNFTQLYALRELISDASYTAATPAMKIDAAGLVGVGTATPASALHVNAAAGASAIRISDTTNGTAGFIGQASALIVGGANTDMAIRSEGEFAVRTNGGSGAERLRIGTTGHVSTGTDNTQTLGTAVKRWSVVYAGTGTINTSDAREKTEIAPLTAAEINATRDLARAIGGYKWLAAVAEKGAAARTHIGLTVQRAIEIMAAHGLDPLRYGCICFDEWPAGAHGPGTPAGSRYSFRTDELLLFIARGFEARLSALEAAAP